MRPSFISPMKRRKIDAEEYLRLRGYSEVLKGLRVDHSSEEWAEGFDLDLRETFEDLMDKIDPLSPSGEESVYREYVLARYADNLAPSEMTDIGEIISVGFQMGVPADKWGRDLGPRFLSYVEDLRWRPFFSGGYLWLGRCWEVGLTHPVRVALGLDDPPIGWEDSGKPLSLKEKRIKRIMRISQLGGDEILANWRGPGCRPLAKIGEDNLLRLLEEYPAKFVTAFLRADRSSWTQEEVLSRGNILRAAQIAWEDYSWAIRRRPGLPLEDVPLGGSVREAFALACKVATGWYASVDKVELAPDELWASGLDQGISVWDIPPSLRALSFLAGWDGAVVHGAYPVNGLTQAAETLGRIPRWASTIPVRGITPAQRARNEAAILSAARGILPEEARATGERFASAFSERTLEELGSPADPRRVLARYREAIALAEGWSVADAGYAGFFWDLWTQEIGPEIAVSTASLLVRMEARQHTAGAGAVSGLIAGDLVEGISKAISDRKLPPAMVVRILNQSGSSVDARITIVRASWISKLLDEEEHLFRVVEAYPELLGPVASSFVDALKSVPKYRRGVLTRYAVEKGKSLDFLINWLKRFAEDQGEEDPQALFRARDRLAQRDPNWAISEFPDEYIRGQKVAQLLDPCMNFLKKLEEQGETLFYHGRDGELLYELAKRKGMRGQYGITSRPLTTLNHNQSDALLHYLRRVCPDDAIHVDTGFAGSIPRWFSENGWRVKETYMVSASDPNKEIPHGVENAREVVLTDLEHSAQRLAKVAEHFAPAELEDLRYAEEAPGFWARLYGVCDNLGLPRKVR